MVLSEGVGGRADDDRLSHGYLIGLAVLTRKDSSLLSAAGVEQCCLDSASCSGITVVGVCFTVCVGGCVFAWVWGGVGVARK